MWECPKCGREFKNQNQGHYCVKGNGYDTYAIPNNDYIAAKQDTWATGEVLAASEAGLIDKEIMGGDYTRGITRLQFSSIAVRLAEKLAGKAITPRPLRRLYRHR